MVWMSRKAYYGKCPLLVALLCWCRATVASVIAGFGVWRGGPRSLPFLYPPASRNSPPPLRGTICLCDFNRIIICTIRVQTPCAGAHYVLYTRHDDAPPLRL